jgi:hypothetical protein
MRKSVTTAERDKHSSLPRYYRVMVHLLLKGNRWNETKTGNGIVDLLNQELFDSWNSQSVRREVVQKFPNPAKKLHKPDSSPVLMATATWTGKEEETDFTSMST